MTSPHSLSPHHLRATPLGAHTDYRFAITTGRNHIHMAVGLPGDEGVVSGMRNQSSVHVYVNVAAVLRAGIPLYVNYRLLLHGGWTGYA